MTDPEEDLLTTEGVDAGSAASAVEGPGSGDRPIARGLPAGPEDERPTPPVDMETEESVRVREELDPGQQLQVGEG